MLKILFLRSLTLALLTLSSPALAQSSAPTPAVSTRAAAGTLTVGVKVAPPFVVKNGNHYSGLGIDLWQKVAADHGWKFHYQPYSLEGLLQAASQGKVDVGIGAITATAAREKQMDFTHTIISTGLGVATQSQERSGWLSVLSALASPAFLSIIGILVVLLLVVGIIAWALERNVNAEQFGETHGRGIFSGFWWAMVTMTTVGYGDIAPRSVGGRILAIIWMLTALIITSFFTAAITSALTVGKLNAQVHSASDLAHMSVCSLPGSTSASWLDSRHIDYRHADNLAAALKQLKNGTCDAVVYDKPLLSYMIGQHYKGKLRVLPLTLARQDYAFALPPQSPLREEINASLLRRINAPNWTTYLNRYLGSDGGGQ